MRAFIAVLSSLFACSQRAEPPSLHGTGGDAWAFEKRVTGTAPADCDDVWVSSPRGAVIATREGEDFSAVVPLVSGDQSLVATCVVSGRTLVSEPQSWRVRLADRPTARARVGIADEGVRLDAGGSSGGPVRGAPVVAVKWTARPGNPAPLATVGGEGLDQGVSGDAIEVRTPAADGEYLVDLEITDAEGVTDRAAAMFRVSYGEALVVDVATDEPDWVEDAVVYGVVPFFYGDGTFPDVTARLEDLQELGVTVLWLSPITAAAEGDFGYAATDLFAVREEFGTEEELDALISGAHARGMRVIMDFVANHTSDEAPYFVQGSQPGSPYADFYDRDANGEVAFYFDWENLPNLDYDNPEVQAMMVEAFAYWVREHDVDGFRADAAWGVKDRAPEFWPRLREELTRIEPDLLLLAEAGARDPYWFDHGFDVAYDWTWELGDWTWDDAFDDPERTVPLLEAALTNDGEGFAADALVFRFLDNNDTGERFVTRYGPERVPVATALLMTVPGVPAVFTGDEVGAEFQPYDEGPPLTWADPHGLRPVWQKAIRIRKEEPALRSRAMRVLDLPGDDVLGYVRSAEEGDVLVLLNFSEEAATVEVAAPEMADEAASGRLLDVWTGNQVASGVFTLPPLTPMVLVRPE